MATRKYGAWQSIIVLGCDHGGLMPFFQRLEDAINRTVNALPDAQDVRDYLEAMRRESGIWFDSYQARKSQK